MHEENHKEVRQSAKRPLHSDGEWEEPNRETPRAFFSQSDPSKRVREKRREKSPKEQGVHLLQHDKETENHGPKAQLVLQPNRIVMSQEELSKQTVPKPMCLGDQCEGALPTTGGSREIHSFNEREEEGRADWCPPCNQAQNSSVVIEEEEDIQSVSGPQKQLLRNSVEE